MMIFSQLNNGLVSVNTMIQNFYNTFFNFPPIKSTLFQPEMKKKEVETWLISKSGSWGRWDGHKVS